MNRSRRSNCAGKRLLPWKKYELLWRNIITSDDDDDEDDSFSVPFSTLVDEYKQVPNGATILLDRRIQKYIKSCTKCAQNFLQFDEEQCICCDNDTNVLCQPSSLETVLETKKRYPISSVAIERLRRTRASIRENEYEKLYDDFKIFPNTLEQCFGWDKRSCYCTTYLRLVDASNFVTTVDKIVQKL